MEEVEYLHGAPTPGAPWLLLCRNSDVLNAGQPTNYDNLYTDLMRTYRDVAGTAMSIEGAAGIVFPHPNAVAKSWRAVMRSRESSQSFPHCFIEAMLRHLASRVASAARLLRARRLS
jgi:hypothetical protein